MTGRFDRNYEINILTPQQNTLIIKPPFSAKFKVKRNTLSSANKTQITIINLDEKSRNQIYKDRYTTTLDWKMELKAGYGSSLYTVFKGHIYEAYSMKQRTEWITYIDCFDGLDAISNRVMNETLAANSTGKDVAAAALNVMTDVSPGALDSTVSDIKFPRGQTLFGQPFSIIENQLGFTPYIDNLNLFILDASGIPKGHVFKLDSEDLLDTPRRRETFIVTKSVFLPSVYIRQVCEIQSKEKKYSGQYVILGIQHDVEISGAKAGNAFTTMELFFGAAGYKEAAPWVNL